MVGVSGGVGGPCRGGVDHVGCSGSCGGRVGHVGGVALAFLSTEKGDIVMEPMNSRDVLPKNVPGVGWGGMGWVM